MTAVDLEDVDDIVFDQSRWHRWVNTDGLRFVASGEAIRTFRFVENPRAVHERTRTLVE